MRGTLRLIPDRAATTRILPKPSSQASPPALQPRTQQPSALVRPSSTPTTSSIRFRVPQTAPRGSNQNQWRATDLGSSSSLLQPSAWRKYGGLGQVRMRHDTALSCAQPEDSLATRIDKSLRDAETELQPEDVASWEAVLTVLRSKHGADGVWAVFQSIQEKGQLCLFTLDNAESLRDEVLSAALNTDSRIAALVNAAQLLSAQENFKWPDLYMKVVHFFLAQSCYDDAVRWHLQLAPTFPPGSDVFGALLASFVANPTPRMQSTLITLYVFSTEHKLYDYLIPALFASGQSKLARTWRKKLILFKDLPSTPKSRPFLRFLANYYPTIQLTENELAVTGLDHQNPAVDISSDELASDVGEPKGIHSDSIVAKWFASTWTSVEFAINLLHRLGLRTIGPRSLQSLALREPDAKDVATRMDQLEKLGIEISSKTYCKILVSFARNGDDELLADLLHCDIHPDEFEDVETRQLLMAEAARKGDWKTERLFQGIEWVVETGPTSRRLNSLLRNELSKQSLGKTRAVLDRMEALKVNMAQYSAIRLLRRVFWGLGLHPLERIRRRPRSRELSSNHSDDPVLDRAIDVTRRISCHDVAIPVQYWKLLLYNLGRLRRLSELEQLSQEIVQLYSPPYGGLIPVHRDDLPAASNADEKDISVHRDDLPAASNADEKEYIPADLPFAHHEHPLRRIFDAPLQRCIVRWGFDQTLARKPESPSLARIKSTNFAEFDVARGVRLLAALRDQGVLIDSQVLRSGVISRIALGQVPGRPRNRVRDSNEVSAEKLKRLVEEAWGLDMFPGAPEMIRELDAHRPKLWTRYPRLFGRAFDERP